MKNSFLTLLYLITTSVFGQSTIDKRIDVSLYKEVIITLDHTFFVDVTNSVDNNLIMSAVSEGEYKDLVLIKVQKEADRISIEDDIQPFSEQYNDKLSAHKVVALKIKLQIPKNLKVTIRSKIASLQMDANFKSIFVELQSGDCSIASFIGDAVINTFGGSIIMHTNRAVVTATSRSGIVALEDIYGTHQVQLKSISGDISAVSYTHLTLPTKRIV